MFERQAQLQSHGLQEIVKLPNLGQIEGEPPTTTTYKKKTRLLDKRFFLNLDTNLSNIVDKSQSDKLFQGLFIVGKKVKVTKVTKILYKTRAWKALDTTNQLLTSFLKAYRTLLVEVLARITNTSFVLEYQLKRFKVVGVVVLAKPKKTIVQKQTLGGWCSIALLSVVDKIIKIVVSKRVVDVVEDYQLLLEGQIDNRRECLTKLVIQVVTTIVYITQAQNTTISLL